MPNVRAEAWTKVTDVLMGQFAPRVKDPADLTRLLDNFKNNDEGLRLAICLAIDLMTEAFSQTTIQNVAAVFDGIEVADSAADASAQFGRLLEANSNRHDLHCASLFSVSESADQYLTVISLKKFIDCAGAAFGYTDDPEDMTLLRKRYGGSPGPISLKGYGAWWPAESRIVWVTCAERFVKKWFNVRSDDRASQVKDALGIPTPPYILSGSLEYVAFQYPPGFTHPSYQPTTLDAWWRDSGWYLSYRKEDGWGRSRSISGTQASHFERVHRAFEFEKISSRYCLWYLGDAVECSEDKVGAINAGSEIVEGLYPRYSSKASGGES